MYIIVGLGNPGLKYETTKHNIGFEVIERLGFEHNIKIDRKKHKALIGQGVIKGRKVILVKPQTYMNLSGESIRSILDFYNLSAANVMIIYDDTSLELGALRIRLKGSAGGHNGVKSLIQHLGTDEFVRIKVGVGEKPPGWDLADYVLSQFTKQEIPIMIDTVKETAKAVEMILDQGVTVSMNQYNRKRKEEADG
ncbi:MAG: aminoacyl-tRNA hydrolase [Vallitaleaceae bacterium]|jgi:PTH1 family peptidyl-tRNA hydrolase|nr:aminoacyl-tRNA hydrolase [Vallitaleaceae bacterium]